MNIRYSFPRRGDYLRTQLIRFTYRFLSIRMNLLKTNKKQIFFYSLETTKNANKNLVFPLDTGCSVVWLFERAKILISN